MLDKMSDDTREFWLEFLEAEGLPKDTECYECFIFGNSTEMANELLDLVIEGKKTATSSSVIAYEEIGKPIPAKGNLSIIKDGYEVPRVVIETTNATIIPFNEMTYDICKREGEDESLDTWVEGHAAYFKWEAEEIGYTFTEDMPICFEDFKVVYQK